jgi:hypothetical protein
MSSADELTHAPAVPSVLKPYKTNLRSARHRRARGWMIVSLATFCLVYGSAFALGAPHLIIPLVIPPLILSMLVVWALPELRNPPVKLMEAFLFALFVTLVMWPNYLAISLPGLPWITLIRVTGLPLLFLFLISLSVSAEFRATLSAILEAVPLLWQALVIFVVIQFLSIGLSADVAMSIQKFVVTQISWTAVFFVSCYVFAKPGRAEFWTRVLWGMALLIGLVAVLEFHEGHVPWAGHVPGFLKINDPSVAIALKGGMRAYTDRYRAQATFSTPIGLGEFMALTMPFIVHIMATTPRWPVRIAALASIPYIVFITFLGDDRSGMLGLLVGGMTYALFWGALQWRRNPTSILGPAVVLCYPVMGAATLALTLFIGRIHRAVWGGAETADSTAGRFIQFHAAWPKILTAPWGYGIGRAAATLGVHTPGGILTIDTYYLSIALDYGVIGFIVYYGMIVIAILSAAKYGLDQRRPKHSEHTLLVPISISLIVFLVIKSVFSQDDNHPLVFMMLGMVVALISRIQQPAGQSKQSPRASAASPNLRPTQAHFT